MNGEAAPSRSVALFGSSRCVPGDPDWKTARDLGGLIARRGWTLATGGYGGVMEAASLGVAEAGGRALGVLVEAFGIGGNPHLTERIVAPDLYTRVRTLIEMADAYVVMPGSTGTLVELALVWELSNKGMLRGRPIICLGAYWKPVIELLAREPLQDSRLSAQPVYRFAGEPIVFLEGADEAVKHLARKWDGI